MFIDRRILFIFVLDGWTLYAIKTMYIFRLWWHIWRKSLGECCRIVFHCFIPFSHPFPPEVVGTVSNSIWLDLVCIALKSIGDSPPCSPSVTVLISIFTIPKCGCRQQIILARKTTKQVLSCKLQPSQVCFSFLSFLNINNAVLRTRVAVEKSCL